MLKHLLLPTHSDPLLYTSSETIILRLSYFISHIYTSSETVVLRQRELYLGRDAFVKMVSRYRQIQIITSFSNICDILKSFKIITFLNCSKRRPIWPPKWRLGANCCRTILILGKLVGSRQR